MKRPGLRFWRRLCQSGAALTFVGVPLLNLCEIDLISGNLLSFNLAGLPFSDPLAALQVSAATLSLPFTLSLGAGLALLLALFMGPVFCSFICPYGLFSELAQKFSPLRGKKSNPGTAQKKSLPSLAGKIFLVCAGLSAVFFFAPAPLLNQLSMPGWYSRALQQAILHRELLPGAALILLILALEVKVGKRFWCRYVCPQSLPLILAARLGKGILPQSLHLDFQRSSCTCPASDRPCLAACSLRLNPRTDQSGQSLSCTNCGDCVEVCRDRGGALRLERGNHFPRPGSGNSVSGQ
ncbi:MAG: 4Fe-4S binding protein [Desulfovibrio sp.]|jgi:ferredoxin-type protein NapH|nr:4Fe-4S binding protein [Desulfovibrio sp.]